jgi:two-component system, OmpR family, response regulator
MHVFLIDDDPEIRMLAGFVLEAAGHRVSTAASGAEGIGAASGEYDLVLLDYRLGDMTGTEVLPVLLRAAPSRPVVFLTGTDAPDAARALLDAGATAVIVKPFDPEALAPRIEQILRSAGS